MIPVALISISKSLMEFIKDSNHNSRKVVRHLLQMLIHKMIMKVQCNSISCQSLWRRQRHMTPCLASLASVELPQAIAIWYHLGSKLNLWDLLLNRCSSKIKVQGYPRVSPSLVVWCRRIKETSWPIMQRRITLMKNLKSAWWTITNRQDLRRETSLTLLQSGQSYRRYQKPSSARNWRWSRARRSSKT